jgi:hypothetical protein
MSGKSFSVNNAAAASITFNPTIALKDGQQYIDSASTMSAPRLAVVKHTIPLTDSLSKPDRHYVQFSKTMYDANGKAFPARFAISVEAPRTVVTAAEMADLAAFVKNFVGTPAIWNAFLLGDY